MFGGVQVNKTQGATDHGLYVNYIEILGLTLTKIMGVPPVDLTDTGVGELTTAVPGPNQNGIPTSFGRGRGKWQPGDENSILVEMPLGFDNSGPGFKLWSLFEEIVPGVRAVRVVNGDLVVSICNPVGDGPGPDMRLGLKFLHTTEQ